MSAYQFDEFERRMRRINRRHSRLSLGYTTKVNDDGLVVARPRRRTSWTTIRGLALIVCVILIFKGFLHAQLGPLAYDERVASLARGNIAEQVGACAMKPEQVTLWISTQVNSLVP